MTLADFIGQFRYKSELTGWVGVERERFIVDRQGTLVPEACAVLAEAHHLDPAHTSRYTYELSACQIEGVTSPSRIADLGSELEHIDNTFDRALALFGFRQAHMAVAPEDMPLDVYPDARYQKIACGMKSEQLRMACQIAATHVHIGMQDLDMALRVYNHVTEHTNELCRLGDCSNGKRLRIYRKMNPDCMPRPFGSLEEFYADAVENGYAEDPKRCWKLLRISVHGTLEFRMGDAMESVEDVIAYTRHCHRLCREAMTA